uniref:Uncharacterized protein n=1 Tax=Aureoumbra lagunensis TaxID=44058 RepID=A0A7S3JW22_9STRA|mmetsp:Transcript_18465/g.27811  ORF Transcript_18465/g.27811 Transcript_18465/m.27811 type:complete len:271 (+) Transcript_18465:44-856(+)|eukprot:CAMPEP_0197314884 /NCGR_PEP_ID=MMETSP0891-20130614/35647_1 /TAXON_ID=44058 ORGANISM="Aureoumbra lagunensis, Strain CCMP1510" /NCGR_SAMPLE_ID=MMETSP0891 /ASSEMBLY_ACC=CAM_ASM_000534 /LENGTH=270 /DNA_ID=CAMNT_0042803547 /DNA_START=15 /DNA_END=827 /DNA_ORIENTATION=+
MNVEELIKSYEKKQEKKIMQAIEDAESQRYWENELVREEPPARSWEEPLGTDKAIWEWRRQFPCLRIRGRAIFVDDRNDQVEEKEESVLGWSDSSDDNSPNFWSQTCEVNPFDQDELPPPEAETWRIVFDNDALDESAVFKKIKKSTSTQPPPPPTSSQERQAIFEPDLNTLTVIGIEPPRRSFLLPEEDEDSEIFASDGEYFDFLALSKWNEPPPSDPDNLFPPPLLSERRDSAHRDDSALRRGRAQAVFVLEACMQEKNSKSCLACVG